MHTGTTISRADLDAYGCCFIQCKNFNQLYTVCHVASSLHHALLPYASRRTLPQSGREKPGRGGPFIVLCSRAKSHCQYKNMRSQMELAANEKKQLEIARRMFLKRFSNDDVNAKTLKELMGMEGKRVRALYDEYAQKYKVGWSGRNYVPGKFELGDLTNRILISAIYSMGFSPHIGFVHSGSPMPFVYDMADLYKEELCIDMAFYLTMELCGQYNKYKVADEFRKRVIEMDLLGRIGTDIKTVLGI